jgi:hypothetical protein
VTCCAGGRYDSILVAETELDMQASTSGRGDEKTLNPAELGGTAFNMLAGYIFGGNAAGDKMKMTTPVFTDTRGKMQFVMEPKYPVRFCSCCDVLKPLLQCRRQLRFWPALREEAC